MFVALTVNMLFVVFVFAIIIVLIVLLVALYAKLKNTIKNYKTQLNNATQNLDIVKQNLKQQIVNVESHSEELVSQTEHLKELNSELEKLSLVANNTDNAVIIANETGKFIWVNQGFEKLFEYTFREFKKHVGDNIYNVSTEMNVRPFVERSVKYKKPLHFTSRIVTKTGKNRWVKTTFNPIFSDTGDIKHFVIVETDVTELKLTNDKLKKLSLVASKTGNSVIILNQNETIDWVNEAFVLLYKKTKDEYTRVFGNTLIDYCKVNNIDNFYNSIVSAKKSIDTVCQTNIIDNNIIWKQINITPVLNEKREVQNYVIIESDITKTKQSEQLINEERNKVNKLLLNILPEETAEELKSKGKATPRFYRGASVLFADIQEFTKLAENLTPDELVAELQLYFMRFDNVMNNYYIEKIKTIGDAYMCVGGIPMRNKSHPFDTVLAALELQRIAKELAHERQMAGKRPWQIRVGIHTGPIVAGVVGVSKMTYDIWGDTVNIAKRIESSCVAGMVNVSANTYEYIKDYFICEHRGKVLAKNKGHIDMYFVRGIKPEFTENYDGVTPNKQFYQMLANI